MPRETSTDILSTVLPLATAAIPGGAAVQAGVGLLESVIGFVNAGKAKREAEELEKTRPTRSTDPIYGQNVALTESELAGGGMSAGAEKAYNNIVDRQFSSSLDSLLRGGGSVNNVADVFDASEQGRQNLALMKDRMRLNQIQNVIASRTALAEEGDKNFLFNKWMPYADKANALGVARQSATNMAWSGLDTAGAGVINGATQIDDNNRYANYFNSFSRSQQPNQVTQQQNNFVPYQFGQYSQGGLYGPPNPDLMQFRLD